MKNDNVKFIKVPRYDEFKAKDVWKQIRNDKKFNIYFKIYSEKAYPDRTYMYNGKFKRSLHAPFFYNLLIFIVINTVEPGKIEELVKKAEKTRKKKYEEEDEGEFIEIHNDIYKLLKLTPVFNSKLNFFIYSTYTFL